jgi:hypothetical protein
LGCRSQVFIKKKQKRTKYLFKKVKMRFFEKKGKQRGNCTENMSRIKPMAENKRVEPIEREFRSCSRSEFTDYKLGALVVALLTGLTRFGHHYRIRNHLLQEFTWWGTLQR